MAFKESKADFSIKSKFTDELASFISHEAGFVTTDGNEAASANMDELSEKAIIASSNIEREQVSVNKRRCTILENKTMMYVMMIAFDILGVILYCIIMKLLEMQIAF